MSACSLGKKTQKITFVPQCWGLTQSTHPSVLRDMWSHVTTGENQFQRLYCISTFSLCNANFSNSALAFLLCLMGEMDIFISLARFLLPSVKPKVITQLRNEATSLKNIQDLACAWVLHWKASGSESAVLRQQGICAGKQSQLSQLKHTLPAPQSLKNPHPRS